MNWLDFVILIVLALCIFWGSRAGLVGAAINFVGLMIGWVIAGRLSPAIGGMFGDSPSMDTIVTVVTYLLILAAAIAITRTALKFLGPGMAIIDMATLGFNRLGGLAVGLLIGIIINATLVTGMTRLAYDFEVANGEEGSLISSNVVVQTEKITAKVGGTKERIEDGLTGSTIVPPFVKTMKFIPGNTLGFVPADFMAALEILDTKL